VGELAFSKEKLLERGSRAQLRFDLFGWLLNGGYQKVCVWVIT
jgi:hypothetical protein